MTEMTETPEQTPQYVDYFLFQEKHKWYFPDNVQWIEYQVMNEGQKAEFQKRTSRDMKVNRNSGDASFRIDPASERHELIKSAVTDWFVMRGGKAIPFNGRRSLDDFLALANPRLIEDLEKAIRKNNPWLLGEMTVEEIDKEIASLEEMREEVRKREQGEGSSGSK